MNKNLVHFIFVAVLISGTARTISARYATGPSPVVGSAVTGVVVMQSAQAIYASGKEEKAMDKNTATNDETFEIEALTFVPAEGEKPGKFVDMRWDTNPYKNGAPRKDLVLETELDDGNGQLVRYARAFNMLPRGRGRSDFKKQMESFLEQPLTKPQLAGLRKAIVVGKPVILKFKKDHLDHVVFDRYLPVKPVESEAALTTAIKP
jgi:hypothetical protein